MSLKLECISCRYWNPDGEKQCRKCQARIPTTAPVRVDEWDGAGKRHRVPTVNRKAAVAIQEEIRVARRKGVGWGDTGEKITLSELAGKYLKDDSIKKKRDFKVRRNYINATVARLGSNSRVSGLSRKKMKGYSDRRKTQGLSGSTINRETTYLHGMLSWAASPEMEIIQSNPIAGYERQEENDARDYVLTDDEYRKLHEALPGHCTPILALQACLPLRPGEAMQLTWDQVRLDAQWPYIVFKGDAAKKTKSGKPRIVPIYFAHLIAMLKEMPSRFAGEAVFTYTGTNWKGPRAFDSWRNAFNTAREKAGLPKFRIYDLRHCAITRLRLAEVPQLLVEHASDHKGKAISDRYTEIGEAAMLSAPKERYNRTSGLIEAVEGYEYDGLGLPVKQRKEGEVSGE